jgi:hypothetical protein
MNGNPNKKQKDFHNELREMYFYTKMHNGTGELHHIFGSKEKFKLLKEAGVDKPGEWLVIMIPRSVHLDIKNYSFEAERAMFLEQKREYEKYFGKEYPVPVDCIRYYNQMLSKQHRLKVWGECLDT